MNEGFYRGFRVATQGASRRALVGEGDGYEAGDGSCEGFEARWTDVVKGVKGLGQQG